MATVFDVLLDVGRLLESLREGAATANGTTTTLIDSTLSAGEGYADDEWNGGTLFWKTSAYEFAPVQVFNEVLHVLASETSLSETLQHRPVVPGSLRFYPPGQLVGDDGAGSVLGTPVEATETFGATLTHTLANVPVEPGSVVLHPISGSLTDDGHGALHWSHDGRWAGTVDYTTGVVDVSEFGLITQAVYNYYTVYGTLDYTTGALSVTFTTPQLGTALASYQYQTPTVFLPLMARTTDFVVSTGTLTFDYAGLEQTVAGDTYGVMTRRYPRWLLIQKLNEALREIKQYLLDSTDIAVSSLVQNEVALADSVRVHSVWLGYTQTTPMDWNMVTRYRHANGRLQFYDYLFGDTLRIRYYGDTTPVSSETDTLPATLDPMWLAYETAVKVARWRLFQPGADEKAQTTLINDLMARRDRQKARANVLTPTPAAFRAAILPER